MLPKEILKKVREIEIRTNRLVNEVFAGEYESVFKGRGIEFAEVREYAPGDDVRTIDWNVTARFGRPFVKQFMEERELTVMLLVDVSGSEHFGSVARTKREIIAEVAAVLAFSAIVNNDKIGYIAFSDQIEKSIPPKKGRRHVLRVIREILYSQAKSRGTNIETALRYLGQILAKRSVVFLISDFWDEGYEQIQRVAQKRHDVIAIHVLDPREREIPDVGFIQLEDPETSERLLIDTSDRRYREQVSRRIQSLLQQRQRLFQSTRLDTVQLRTDQPYLEPLIHFFEKRAKRFR
ncbi:MAG: DUF58 domain-containing protein [Candidatus Omnitrophica bacterium]|nr:DUF58 domain-containing protein [Candidatus Omnitrophota bacterium]